MKAVTQSRALETRGKILQAAACLFALKGYHDTKLEEVLGTAQVTKGAFFHHFRDREDLGFAVLDWHGSPPAAPQRGLHSGAET